MRSQKIKEVLRIICQELENKDVNWALVGSTNLALQEVDVEPHDVDILTDKEGAFLIHKLLKEYEVKEVKWSRSDKFASWLGELRIKGVKVEIMGNLKLKDTKGKWSETTSLSKRKLMKIDDCKIPIIPLRYELKAYEKLGRSERVRKIKEALKKHMI